MTRRSLRERVLIRLQIEDPEAPAQVYRALKDVAAWFLSNGQARIEQLSWLRRHLSMAGAIGGG